MQKQAFSCILLKYIMKSFFLFFLVLLFIFTPFSFAQGDVAVTVEGASDSAEAILENTDEYQLPYPGMLPDNPLYPLKTFRDKVVSFLITDPLKKAEFNILQADKRLQAGIYLIDKSKKYKLAIETISKGENYLDEAFLKTNDAYKQGMDTGVIRSRLEKSVSKHDSVISTLTKKSPKEFKAGFENLRSRVEKYKAQVNKLKS